MQANRQTYPVKMMCAVYGVTRGGFWMLPGVEPSASWVRRDWERRNFVRTQIVLGIQRGYRHHHVHMLVDAYRA